MTKNDFMFDDSAIIIQLYSHENVIEHECMQQIIKYTHIHKLI